MSMVTWLLIDSFVVSSAVYLFLSFTQPGMVLLLHHGCLFPIDCPEIDVDSASDSVLRNVLWDLLWKILYLPVQIRTISVRAFRLGTNKYILDSGASANLVNMCLQKETIQGQRRVYLAAGHEDSKDVTSWGSIISEGEQLLSLGRTVSAGADFQWTSSACSLQLNGQVHTIPVVNHSPVVSAELATEIREFQHKAQTINFVQQEDSEDLSFPSVYLLGKYSKSFDFFYARGDFEGMDFDSVGLKFAMHQLFEIWEQSEGPKAFHSWFDIVNEPESHQSLVFYRSRAEEPVPEPATPEFDFYRIEDSKVSKERANAYVMRSNANAQSPPQRRTTVDKTKKFYRSLKGRWLIWGDIVYATSTAFDGCRAAWVFHCSRMIPKRQEQDQTIETLVVSVPIRESTGATAISSLRFVLEKLGVGDSLFYFESEGENVTMCKEFQEFLSISRGMHHTSIPYRHPGRENAVKGVLQKIRQHLQDSSLPITAWSSIARAQSEETISNMRLPSTYENQTFKSGYTATLVGTLAKAFVPHHSNALNDKMKSRQIPVMILDSKDRNRVRVIHKTEKSLGFRYTEIPWAGVVLPKDKEYVFQQHVEQLQVQRYMSCSSQEFQDLLVKKPRSDIPKRLTCGRCLRIAKNRDEDGEKRRGHTCDQGCSYQCYHCFDNLESFDFKESDNIARLCKFLVSTEPEVSEIIDTSVPSEKPESKRRLFSIHHEEEPQRDVARYKRIENSMSDTTLRTFVAGEYVTSEEAATTFFLLQEHFHQAVLEQEKIESSKRVNQEEFQIYALVVSNKDVQQSVKIDPKALEAWSGGAEREVRTMLERGVLSLVHISDVRKLPAHSYEMIPSLCVWSKKSDGTSKARLVACGNFQDAPNQDDGLQAGNYSGTTSFVTWRSLLAIFIKARGSVACLDVSEAFTQSDERSSTSEQDSDIPKHKDCYMRLPSQWKSSILPSILMTHGVTSQNYGDWLLKILKSIYGEKSAPKMWSQTVHRILRKLGFKALELDENLFFKKSQDGLPIIVSTYVDDVWGFSLNSEALADVMTAITEEVKCTKISFLCGAPSYLFKSSSSFKEEYAQRFTVYDFSERWAIADHTASLTYVGVDLYFDEQGNRLILSQSVFFEKSLTKLLDKGVVTEADLQSEVRSLDSKKFSHLWLTEESEENRLLTSAELTLLRAGINTLSYASSSTAYHLQAPLGQIARGQSSGRLRHLQMLRVLINYAHVYRHFCVTIVSGQVSITSVNDLKIYLSCMFDASMGQSNALGCDGHARQGFFISLGLNETTEEHCVIIGRSSLQSTVSLSTCEAELTASSFAARNLEGIRNVLSECGFSCMVPTLSGDNQAANRLAACQSSIRHHRHLMLPQLWIRNLSRDGRIRLYDVRSQFNTSDLLTKSLSSQVLLRLLPLLGIQEI